MTAKAHRRGLGCGFDGAYQDLGGSAAMGLEGNHTVNQGVESVISADANVTTGMELGSTLAHDDGSCTHFFAAEGLHTQHFGVGISTVLCTTTSFF